MRKIIMVLLAVPLFIYSQDVDIKTVERGWAKIDFIMPLMYKNDIISHEEAYNIIKSIGYRILPESIILDQDMYLKKHGLTETTRHHILFESPELYIDLFVSEKSKNNYFGYLNVSLREETRSNIIQYNFPDMINTPWHSFIGYAHLIYRRVMFDNYTKSNIKEEIRQLVQEVFEELSIKIREMP